MRLKNCRITATLSCPMKLHKYPLDTQTCPMMFESCQYILNYIVIAININNKFSLFFASLFHDSNFSCLLLLHLFTLSIKQFYDHHCFFESKFYVNFCYPLNPTISTGNKFSSDSLTHLFFSRHLTHQHYNHQYYHQILPCYFFISLFDCLIFLPLSLCVYFILSLAPTNTDMNKCYLFISNFFI